MAVLVQSAAGAYELQRWREDVIEEQPRMNANCLHQAHKRVISDIAELTTNDLAPTICEEHESEFSESSAKGYGTGRGKISTESDSKVRLR